jgi:hypothetical protein
VSTFWKYFAFGFVVGFGGVVLAGIGIAAFVDRELSRSPW